MSTPALLLLSAALAFAGDDGSAPPAPAPGTPAALTQVGFDPPLGQRVPVDVRLRDSTGQEVALGDLLHRPTVLVPMYYECPMLCSLVADGLQRALADIDLDVGRDLDVVVFSIDPDEGPDLAREARDTFLQRYGRAGAGNGVHFLTGTAAAVARLTDALGFRYVKDEQTGEYAHAAGVLVLTAEGTLSRYLAGVDYPSRDLQLALVDAGQGTVGDVADQALLLCYRYDPTTGRYSAKVLALVRVGGVATLAGLVLLMLWSRRRGRRQRARDDRVGEAA
jgi:protein SCO1/2